MYQIHDDYDDARRAFEAEGGWLLRAQDGTDSYIVTDDEGTVADLLGTDFVSKCERLQVWDQTIVDRHRTA